MKFTASYVHDLLKAYYQVASKRFVDTICLQATGYCLLHGPRRPLGLFSPTLVAEFTEEQLEEIAGEDARVSMQRALLKKEIEDLRAAKAIMR